MRTTGYWFLDRERDWRPPEELRAFLEAGEPPVSLCLGSMGGIESVRRGRIFTLTARALRLAGRRGVLLGSSGGGDVRLPDNVIQIAGEVPYGWLFRRVAVAVHHGGAGHHGRGPEGRYPFRGHPCGPGSGILGLAGGRPRVRDRTRSHRKRLTAERLASAILQAASDTDMRRRCEELGEKISAEDGVARAVEAFEEHVGKRR